MRKLPIGLTVGLIATTLIWAICLYVGGLKLTIVAWPVAVVAGILGGKWDIEHP